MKNQIMALVNKLDNVTFIDLSNQVTGFKGDFEYLHKEYDNVILWRGISYEAIEALTQLLYEQEIFIKEAELVTYAYHRFPGFQGLETYETAKRLKKGVSYWLPVVFTSQP